jgi:Zn-dependent M28 family amino/carboxypeptidase
MKTRIIRRLACAVLVLVLAGSFVAAQSRALKAISVDDMKIYMKFLAAKEFRGRSAPSFEQEIAAKYIALEAARIGLKPLLPDGSYFQPLPVEVATMSPAKSHLRVLLKDGELKFYFPQSFTSALRTGAEWAMAGGLVFAGMALNASPIDEKAFEGIDLRGKIVVLLEAPRPAVPTGAPAAGPGGGAAAARVQFLRAKGAVGTITIIGPERENSLRQNNLLFDLTERYRWLDVDTVNPAQAPAAKPAAAPAAPQATLYAAEARQDAGAAILGINGDELDGLFTAMSKNIAIPPKVIEGRSAETAVAFDQRLKTTPNVVAYLPGSDPVLKNEYVVLSSHSDHLSFREGRIFPGADDNMSGCVAMLEIAKALMFERPKRSVIFVWNTAEERGLIGSYYFVQHCPVPVEKISANLNFDMITRNDPNSIFLIGSNKISSELDKSINAMNTSYIHMKMDYKYEDPGEPNRFFFRSDQYPYIRYGIPGVWFFCGTTPDYHTENDVEEKCDYTKMEKVTKLVYLTTLDIGNKPALLKLDLNSEVTTRGKHNMKVVWQRPPQPPQK